MRLLRTIRILAAAALALAAALLATPSAHAQASCATATNDCFTANPLGAGCNNPQCCNTVCTIEPFCCDAGWDEVCVALARKFCSTCGSVPDSCFTPHLTPSCNNGVVCEAVCATLGFEYCCDAIWDQGCVELARELSDGCGKPAAGSCLTPHENKGCADEACCEAVCDIDPLCCTSSWDVSCTEWAERVCISCGNPRAGSCCHQNATPYCDDRACCELVCAFDPFCCETRWDSRCGREATDNCGLASCKCGFVDPAAPFARSCRTAHPQPGCDDRACCDEVCYADEYCCAVGWDFTCVQQAVSRCSLANDPDINVVCSSATGSCFVAHGFPGCSDDSCCGEVCTADPGCCDVAWDQTCADRAALICNGCGDIDAGSCYYPHGTPSCLDATCCDLVCNVDQTCCEIQWDIFCVLQAGTLCVDITAGCGDARTRPCTLASYVPACEDQDCCQFVCNFDATCCSRAWDETCAANAVNLCDINTPNCPGRGSPLEVHATPGCVDEFCCAAVCAVDPLCCQLGWNQRCVDVAKGVCFSFGDCPGIGPCGTAHPEPGCADATCCNIVCEFDPLCCEVAWSSSCASQARARCYPNNPAWPCPCAGSCFESHPENGGCEDEVCCAGVCAIDPACCTESWDAGCAQLARVTCCGFPGCGNNCAGSCLEPHDTPFCNDPACCEAVCRFEPFCCEVRWDSSCVLTARETCFGGCGLPTNGNCFNAHEQPGCSIAPCCEDVCAQPEFELCCLIEWDETCAAEARKRCSEFLPDCGDVGLPGCNFPRPGPGCGDEDCCEAVCAIDAFCCESEWDATCVERIYVTGGCERYQFDCGSECAGACCEPHRTPWCNDRDCCLAVCLIDNFCCTVEWDEFCATTATVTAACNAVCPDPKCGTPEAGNCCFQHPNANCSDSACCDTVCAIDDTCCEVIWDSVCAAIANAECDVCQGTGCGSPDAGSCCNEHPTGYCDNEKCCALVCSFDESCCTTAWDTTCVQLAQLFCGCQ